MAYNIGGLGMIVGAAVGAALVTMILLSVYEDVKGEVNTEAYPLLDVLDTLIPVIPVVGILAVVVMLLAFR